MDARSKDFLPTRKGGTSESPILQRLDATAQGVSAEYVTTEEIQLSTRKQAAYQPRPVLGLYSGLFSSLSKAFSTTELTNDYLDRTGVRPKITYVANVNASITARAQKVTAENFMVSKRPIHIDVGIPTVARVVVSASHGFEYLNPGIIDASLTYPGSWPDKAGHINFYNHIAPRNNCFFTAAAMQMGLYYINGSILPKLNQGARPLNFLPVAGANMAHAPTAQQTVFMPHLLSTQLSNDCLCVLYHALESDDVMAAAGLPVINRVYNAAGPINGCAYSDQAWYEAWHVLRQAACGMGAANVLEADFLLSIIQNFPVHGYCDEGGLWRVLFSNLRIEPNAGVIVCDFNRSTTGFINFTCAQVIASATTLQTIISRCLYDTKRNETSFILPAGATNDEVKSVVDSMYDAMVDNFCEGTDLPREYWTHYLTSDMGPLNGIDRHISLQQLNYLKMYSSWMPTYALKMSGNTIGAFDNVSVSNLTFVKFTGTATISEQRFSTHLCQMFRADEPWSFANGWYWLHPKINPSDGLMETTYDGGVLNETNASTDTIHFLDGSVATINDRLGNHIWRDNGDILPCAGELRTNDLGMQFAVAATLPEYATAGEYVVTIEKYRPLGKQRGEVKNSTPATSRWQVYFNRMYHMEDFAGSEYRPQSPELRTVLQQWKRYDRIRCERELARREKAEIKERENRLDELVALGCADEEDDAAARRLIANPKIAIMGQLGAITCTRVLVDVIKSNVNAFSQTADVTKVLNSANLMILLKGMSVEREAAFRIVDSKMISNARQKLAEMERRFARESPPVLVYGWGSDSKIWDEEEYVLQLNQFAASLIVTSDAAWNRIDSLIHVSGGDEWLQTAINSSEEWVHDLIAAQVTELSHVQINCFLNDDFNYKPSTTELRENLFHSREVARSMLLSRSPVTPGAHKLETSSKAASIIAKKMLEEEVLPHHDDDRGNRAAVKEFVEAQALTEHEPGIHELAGLQQITLTAPEPAPDKAQFTGEEHSGAGDSSAPDIDVQRAQSTLNSARRPTFADVVKGGDRDTTGNIEVAIQGQTFSRPEDGEQK